MKVRLTLDVGAHERYVVAKYFAPAAKDGTADRRRLRASRAQVRRFVAAALRSAVRDHVERLRGKSRGTAHRLEAGAGGDGETLTLPPSPQRSLEW